MHLKFKQVLTKGTSRKAHNNYLENCSKFLLMNRANQFYFLSSAFQKLLWRCIYPQFLNDIINEWHMLQNGLLMVALSLWGIFNIARSLFSSSLVKFQTEFQRDRSLSWPSILKSFDEVKSFCSGLRMVKSRFVLMPTLMNES